MQEKQDLPLRGIGAGAKLLSATALGCDHSGA
jgi:hypothetical protein